jgi:hypothetical protein
MDAGAVTLDFVTQTDPNGLFVSGSLIVDLGLGRQV